MLITLVGNVPAKKNARNLFVRNGRIVNTPNNKYTEWEKDCLYQLKEYRGQMDVPVRLTVTIFNKDRRARDLDNQLSSVLDMLVKSSLLEDDNCFVVDDIRLKFGGVDKHNPRAEVEVHENQPL